MGLLQNELTIWSWQKEVRYNIHGVSMPDDICHDVLQRLVRGHAFETGALSYHIVVLDSDAATLNALRLLEVHQVAVCTSRGNNSSTWALSTSGMQRLRPCRMLATPKKFFSDHELDLAALKDATQWELLKSLQRQRWVLRKRPTGAKLKALKAAPFVPGGDKFWYLPGTSLVKHVGYMRSLASAEKLIADGAVCIHHCQAAKYYQQLLDRKTDGSIQAALADAPRPRNTFVDVDADLAPASLEDAAAAGDTQAPQWV